MSGRHPHGDAFGDPGEVVTARVYHPLEDPSGTGKVRPVVLIRREGGQWICMGLTSKSTFANGRPRTRVPDPSTVGLSGPGHLWGKPTRISVMDVQRHLGWVDEELVATIILEAPLCPLDAASLVRGLIADDAA